MFCYKTICQDSLASMAKKKLFGNPFLLKVWNVRNTYSMCLYLIIVSANRYVSHHSVIKAFTIVVFQL